MGLGMSDVIIPYTFILWLRGAVERVMHEAATALEYHASWVVRVRRMDTLRGTQSVHMAMGADSLSYDFLPFPHTAYRDGNKLRLHSTGYAPTSTTTQ
jgi:hypothetical protein